MGLESIQALFPSNVNGRLDSRERLFSQSSIAIKFCSGQVKCLYRRANTIRKRAHVKSLLAIQGVAFPLQRP